MARRSTMSAAALVDGLASGSQQTRADCIRALADEIGKDLVGSDRTDLIRRLLEANTRALLALLEAVSSSRETERPAGFVLFALTATRERDLPDAKWLTTQALSAAGSTDSLVAMMVGAKDEACVSVALNVFSEVLQRGVQSGDSGARDLLLSKHYDIVTTCLTYLASQRDSQGYPFILRLIFIESIFSRRFPTPPAPRTWEPLLPCLCEALLRDDALRSARLSYIRHLNQIIAECISSASTTSASEILSRFVSSHLESSMAILDSGGSTDSLNAIASMRWRASIAISLMFYYTFLLDDDADLTVLYRLCERLLEAPRVLRIVADHLMRGLKEPEPLVQTVSGDRSDSRRAVDECRALSGLAVCIPRALICAGHTAAAIQAGFPDVIMALTQHCQHSRGFFNYTPRVLGVMDVFTLANSKMMIDIGAVEVVCDLLLRRHAEKTPAHATTSDSPAPIGLVGGCWQILGRMVVYGESRVRPNAPYNKVSQKILQNASVQKLRELHCGTGGLDVQDTSRRPKAKKGRIKGHSKAKTSQPCSPPDPTSCPPSSSSSPPSDQKADGAAGEDAAPYVMTWSDKTARGATPLAGVLAFFDQIEEKENERAAVVLADLMATDERAEKDKTAGKGRGGGKARKGKGPPSVAESARSYDVCVDGRDASDRVAAAGPQAGSAAGAGPGERDPQPRGRRRKNRKKKLNKGRGESQSVESVAEEGVEHDGDSDVEDARADGDDIDTQQERPMSESADTTRPSSRSSGAEPLRPPTAKPLQSVGSGTAGQVGSGLGTVLREGHGLAGHSASVSGAVAASVGAGAALTLAADKEHPPQQDGDDSGDEEEHEAQTQMAIAASLHDATTAAMVRPPSMPPSSSLTSGGSASGAPAAAAAAASLGPLKDAVCRAIEEQQSMERAYGEALERHSTIMERTNELTAAIGALAEATQEQPDTLTRDALMAPTTAAEVCEFGERVTREGERLDQLYCRACDSSRPSSSDTRADNGSESLFGRLPSPSAAFDVARNNDRIQRSSRHDKIADEVDSVSSEGQLREMRQSTEAKLRQLEADISTVTEATAAAEAKTQTLQEQHDNLLQRALTGLTEHRLSSLRSPEDVEAFKRDITKARAALRALAREASKMEGRLEDREAAAASAAAAPPPPPRPICGICNDSPPTVLFYPCGHLCLCADCWQQWKGRHERAKAEKERLEGAGQPVPEEVRRYAVMRCPSCRSEPEKTIVVHVQTDN
ncbi:unnamed protein product [Vitrella brassicaformis CCMP3155]|uniref:RING-type domain-containing protein n=2 Tax=Vitrella brassicaformis TaxID=1169539 RepID=A0A0G4GE13_VITBC|nr:unnamed protein product [Vitrella brassicaformis CCMP3155]|eukprot:CEM27228.1 unnamed protein product [Vitrella brassicaformis CCMP3155]